MNLFRACIAIESRTLVNRFGSAGVSPGRFCAMEWLLLRTMFSTINNFCRPKASLLRQFVHCCAYHYWHLVPNSVLFMQTPPVPELNWTSTICIGYGRCLGACALVRIAGGANKRI